VAQLRRIPDLAKRVVVPLANPATARGLLDLALTLVEPERGEVIGVVVLKGDVESEADVLEKIEQIIDAYKSADRPVSLRTPRASNIARGILDAAHENAADLLVLGLHRRGQNQVDLGQIAKNVLATAPCDVVLYRPGRSSRVSRVVVPADGTQPAQAAGRVGLRLAAYYDAPIEGMYVQESFRPRYEGLGRIDQSFEGGPEEQQVRRTLINAHDPVEAILSRLNEDDLLVVGYAPRMAPLLDRLMGDFSERMLNEAPCAVVVTARAAQKRPLLNRAQRLINRYTIRLTPSEQDDINRYAYELSEPNADYLTLIVVSATLATLGLLLNSPAVIIGAMLVAPFMQPCIGFAVGITTGRLSLVRGALVTLAAGVLLALAVAALWGRLVGGGPPTPEMLARGNPSLLDALVALASGVIGAYATARKDVSTALAGVAIAAALMPPLCTAGLELAAGRTDVGLRAALLFFTNIVCISVSAWVVFLLLGMRPRFADGSDRRRYGWFAAVTVLMLPMVIGLIALSRAINPIDDIQDILQQHFPDARVIAVEVRGDNPVAVRARVETAQLITPRMVAAAEADMAEQLGHQVGLEIELVRLVLPPGG